MFDAMDVARHLIRLGYAPECPAESVLISPLRLQKLLYYCQGWSLGLRGRPLFRQPLEAWKRGPAVAEVYERFQDTRDGLTPERAGEPTADLPTADAALVEMVWREYARYTPDELCEMTHDEPAWREARGNLPPTEPSSAHLSTETMANYFRDLARKRAAHATRPGFPVLDPVAVWKAEDELERTGGAGTPAAEVFGKLLAEAGE
jgi:uncharacterized phage-associated protein